MTTKAPLALTSDQLAETLANIDLGTKRWRRKVRIIAVVGRWGRLHEVSQRQLAERCSVSPNLLIDLLEELARARILVCWYAPEGGTRAAAYTVNPNIEQWGRDRDGVLVDGGVPWLREVAAVWRWVFHGEPEEYAEPGLRREGGPYTRRRPAQRREGGPDARRSPEQRREGASNARRRGITASRGCTDSAWQGGPVPQEVPTWEGGSGSSPPPGGAGGWSDALEGEFRRARAGLLAAADNGGRAKFLNGPPADQLQELVAAHGADQLLAWLLEAPGGLGVPRMVDWLVDRAHQPDPEMIEQLRNRPEPAQPVEAPPPAPDGPRVKEFTGHDYGEEPAAGADVVRQLRASMRTPQDLEADIIETTTGGPPS